MPGLNIRFLCQGMLKVAAAKLPADFFAWTTERQIEWARHYLASCEPHEIAQAVMDIMDEQDVVPDCLEVDAGDYPWLAVTKAWQAFNAPEYWRLFPAGK